jgi:hypothetical protein
MGRTSHISTESDYLRAHLTIIASESRGQLRAFRNLRQRATTILKVFYEIGSPPSASLDCSSKQVSIRHDAEVDSRGVAACFVLS